MTSLLKEQGDFFLRTSTLFSCIAHCDFFLFPHLMKNLAGRKYTSHQKLGALHLTSLEVYPKKDYEKAVPKKRLRESLQGLD